MKSLRYVIVLLATSTSLMVGCTGGETELGAADFDVPLETAGWGGSTDPPIGINGLKPIEFWSPTAQNALRDLGKVALSDGGSFTTAAGDKIPMLPSIPSLDLLQSTYPDVISHLIECALRDREQIYDPINGRELRGWWGLGSSWLAGKLSGNTEEERWVTGCMLARLNSLGVHEDLLLEGAVSQIEVNATYNPIFKFNESTLMGNMFNSTMPAVQYGIPHAE